MSEEVDATNSPAIPPELQQPNPNVHVLNFDHILNLHVQEYIALRAEQRTRLDSANRIIHYYAILLAAVIIGLVNVYKNGEEGVFNSVFPIVLLSIPVVTIPFVFAQQNEEIIVRNIGDYFRQIKSRISNEKDDRYWKWEGYHYSQLSDISSSGVRSLQLTAFFRAGLLIFFSTASLIVYYLTCRISMPWTFALDVYRGWPNSRQAFYMGTLLFFDWVLIIVASRIGIGMLRARVSLREVIGSIFRRRRRKQTPPNEQAQSETNIE